MKKPKLDNLVITDAICKVSLIEVELRLEMSTKAKTKPSANKTNPIAINNINPKKIERANFLISGCRAKNR